MPDLPAASVRQRVLAAAFAEFYRHGFQGGSLNRIVDAADVTKGALFHHFDGKQALGYAVVDEIIGPLLTRRWTGPLADTDDPLAVLDAAVRQLVEEDVASGAFVQGCPLNNFAQEMSPLDEGFRTRIDALYDAWRAAVAAAVTRGAWAGTVRADADPAAVAALVVVAQMGIWGTGKASQDPALMRRAAGALGGYLHALRAEPPAPAGPRHARARRAPRPRATR